MQWRICGDGVSMKAPRIMTTLGMFVALGLPHVCSAQVDFLQYMQQRREAFQQYQEETSGDYRRYYEEQQRRFEAYIREIAARWGDGNVQISTLQAWVSYRSNYLVRRTVDFRAGDVRVEVLVDPQEGAESVSEQLASEVRDLVTTMSDSSDQSARDKITTIDSVPVLADQLALENGEPVSLGNADRFAEEIVATAPRDTAMVVGDDGTRRTVVGIRFPLVPDHIRRRAERFKELVRQQSRRFQLDARVVFAIIHTESWFNPLAQSPTGAYGLMQLIPHAGARDAYRHLYNEDRVVTPAYLYVPKNNVELGTAYLSLLQTDRLRDVENTESRLLCAIAAYNTGPTNMAMAFSTGGDLERAINMINRLGPEQVFQRLRQRLPYQETRAYVQAVRDRVDLYHEWATEIVSFR